MLVPEEEDPQCTKNDLISLTIFDSERSELCRRHQTAEFLKQKVTAVKPKVAVAKQKVTVVKQKSHSRKTKSYSIKTKSHSSIILKRILTISATNETF